MHKKIVFTIMYASFMLILTIPLEAYSSDKYTKDRVKHKKTERLFKALDLSQDQIQQITHYRSQNKTQRQRLYSEIKTLKEQRDMLISSNPSTLDQETLSDIKAQLDKHLSELSDLNLRAQIHFNQVLTDEQRQKIQKLKSKRKKRVSQRTR